MKSYVVSKISNTKAQSFNLFIYKKKQKVIFVYKIYAQVEYFCNEYA